MHVIADFTNAKSKGTFKFQYSKYFPMRPDPRFIPQDKKLAEEMIGRFFTAFLKKHFGANISKFELNEDDSNKKSDVSYEHDGIKKELQITQLQFTQHEMRRALSLQKSKEIVNILSKIIQYPFPVIINIFPSSSKDKIPLAKVKKGKSKIEQELIVFIGKCLKDKFGELSTENKPVWIPMTDTKLSAHFKFIVLNPVPKSCFPNFYGKNNIYVNYDFNDVAYQDSDMINAIDNLYTRKNNGHSDILLIWADKFELVNEEREIAERLTTKFYSSTFSEVFFMTFENSLPLFEKSLQFWKIKPASQIK